ncbi:MAG: hypothetical protein ACFFG0_02130 [Candidatus Thorarchaeota archaeon]
MSKFKDEIIRLGNTSLLNNREIARIVGCSEKTVSKYVGSFSSRCKFKTTQEDKMFEIQKVVLLPDIHYPHIDERVMECLNRFIFDYEPNEIVYMGDQMSLDCISTWNKKKPLLKEGQRLINDYKNFDEDILKVHENITDSETRRVFMIGNHEQRVQWYIEQNPEFEKMIDIETHLNLEERGYQIIPFNGIYKIGKLNVIHGYYWNKYHAAKTVEAFEGNVVYSHVHNPQMYAKISPVDTKGYHMATALPCLCNIKPDYKKNLPNFWINGFGIVEYLPATGFFNLYTIVIIDGSFMFNGIYYGKEEM